MTAVAEATKLRCRSRLQGIIKEYPNGKRLLEIKCKDKLCADRRAGVYVLHYYDLESGQLVNTKKFRDPKRSLENEMKGES
jgi:hypothetical protein